MREVTLRLVAAAAVAFALVAAPETGLAQVIPKPRPEIGQSKPGKTAKVEKKAGKPAKVDHGSVYLLRGLANIFSLGMDTLGNELEKRGVDTVVTNHSHGFEIVDKLAKQYEADKSMLPIILIGHSLGGNKTLAMAQRLAEKNIPVRLLVIFDATRAAPVPLNVQEVLNLYKPKSVGVQVAGAPGYKGTIDNKDVSDIPGVGHISIDKSKKLHAEVIDKVLAVLAEDPLPKKKAPRKKPVIVEQPVAKAPETTPPETKTPEVMEAKTPETSGTTTPEVEDAKAPEAPATKAPAVKEVKAPEAGETKTPEPKEAKAPEVAATETTGSTKPPLVPTETKPAAPAAAAAN